MEGNNEKNSDGKIEPVLKLEFLSHGTLEVDDVDASRRFYEEFLGFEVVRTSPISLMFRLGGTHSYACLLYTSPSPRDRQKSRMPSSA